MESSCRTAHPTAPCRALPSSFLRPRRCSSCVMPASRSSAERCESLSGVTMGGISRAGLFSKASLILWSSLLEPYAASPRRCTRLLLRKTYSTDTTRSALENNLDQIPALEAQRGGRDATSMKERRPFPRRGGGGLFEQ